jgi:hypothetical protein
MYFGAKVSMFAAGESLCVVGLGDCWIYVIVGVMSVNANTFYFP